MDSNQIVTDKEIRDFVPKLLTPTEKEKRKEHRVELLKIDHGDIQSIYFQLNFDFTMKTPLVPTGMAMEFPLEEQVDNGILNHNQWFGHILLIRLKFPPQIASGINNKYFQDRKEALKSEIRIEERHEWDYEKVVRRPTEDDPVHHLKEEEKWEAQLQYYGENFIGVYKYDTEGQPTYFIALKSDAGHAGNHLKKFVEQRLSSPEGLTWSQLLESDVYIKTRLFSQRNSRRLAYKAAQIFGAEVFHESDPFALTDLHEDRPNLALPMIDTSFNEVILRPESKTVLYVAECASLNQGQFAVLLTENPIIGIHIFEQEDRNHRDLITFRNIYKDTFPITTPHINDDAYKNDLVTNTIKKYTNKAIIRKKFIWNQPEALHPLFSRYHTLTEDLLNSILNGVEKQKKREKLLGSNLKHKLLKPVAVLLA